jgi:hypothetical protein
MEFTTFVRKPFKVKAVKVTRDNIVDIANLIGWIRFKNTNNEEPYVQVDPRKVANIPYVYLGYYMTEMGDNIRCYSGKIFEQQFVENSPSVEEWIAFLNQSQDNEKEEAEAPVVESNA